MFTEPRFKKLLEPFEIKNVRLKNRIVKSPFVSTTSDRDGYVTDSLIEAYRTIANGGVGLSIVEGTAVDHLGVSGSPRLGIYDDTYIPGFSRLADAIHKCGCPAFLQLHHAGPGRFDR